MKKNAKIYVAGNTGLVGSAIIRKLRAEGYNNLVFTPFPDYDLRNQQQVNDFFEKEKPEYVFLAAAKVGGILANSKYKAEFIYDNMMIEFNVIHASYIYKVKKLLFLGSSCIYPKNCPQPIKEEYLLTGCLEETNEPYALAKISGLKMCDYYREQYGCDFISAMPTNLYGENDNFNLETSHVMPAMIRKMHLAKCLENNDFEAIRKDLETRPYSTKEKYTSDMTDHEILELLTTFGINCHRTSQNNTDIENKTDDILCEDQCKSVANNLSLSLDDSGSPYCGKNVSHYHQTAQSINTNENVNDYNISANQCKSVANNVSLSLWGSGSPYREFLHSDDLADALLFLMGNYSDYGHINVGTGEDLTIKELAEMIKEIVGFDGSLQWDSSKPDGTSKKLLETSKLMEIGWKPKIDFLISIKEIYTKYIG